MDVDLSGDSTKVASSPLGTAARLFPSRLLLLSRSKTLSDVIVERDLVRLRFVPTHAIDAHIALETAAHWRLLTTCSPPLPLRSTAAVATSQHATIITQPRHHSRLTRYFESIRSSTPQAHAAVKVRARTLD
jgi:hypothetical protein